VLSIKINANNRKFRILLLGAHCDDIEIGCGGTLLKLLGSVANPEVHWIVFSSDETRKREAVASANAFLKKIHSRNIQIESFKNSYFPYIGADIKEYFERLKREVSPDIIFTHYRNDLHQDHRIISELTWNTFRDHWILEYEIPKFDGDMGTPNFFVHLDASQCREKVSYLMKYFGSQLEKRWFTRDLFYSTLRIRGMESNSPSKYAEGFYSRKSVM
jgi:LmbE family N-acetylglucosaminyl deacetylase